MHQKPCLTNILLFCIFCIAFFVSIRADLNWITRQTELTYVEIFMLILMDAN